MFEDQADTSTTSWATNSDQQHRIFSVHHPTDRKLHTVIYTSCEVLAVPYIIKSKSYYTTKAHVC